MLNDVPVIIFASFYPTVLLRWMNERAAEQSSASQVCPAHQGELH